MHTVTVSSELVYDVVTPTSFVFGIAAANTHHQEITSEWLELPPAINVEWCNLNDYGCRGIRLDAQPGPLNLSYNATLNLSPDVDSSSDLGEMEHKEIPVEILPFLSPSRYCESDQLARYAWKAFGLHPPGYSRVEAICAWVQQNIDYVAGSTDASSSACDVLILRAGVCRDFAHVSIAMCRALGIPARYISGYAVALEPPDFHGFFEAFLEGRWYLFDATRMAPVSGFVRVGVGRDAADTPFATIVGQATLERIHVTATSAESTGPVDTDDAISTA